MALVTYRYSDIILMYAPKGNEINIMRVAGHALNSGKIVAFPKCNTSDCTMTYHAVTDLSQLELGTYGILEPPSSLPLLKKSDIKLFSSCCLVPALVYDSSGYRLGYGKGYYDRYLSTFSGSKVGFVYSDFVVEEVPRGRFDLSVDIVVTEKGVNALHAC